MSINFLNLNKMGNSRIPVKMSEFDGYLKTNDLMLHEIISGTVSRGQNLGMLSTELATFRDFSSKWRSGDAANPGVYEQHLDKEKKNKVTRAKVLKLMKDFSVFFRPVLVRISGSPNITSDDRIALNIAEPVTSHSHHYTPIEQRCFAGIIMMGGGMVKIKCRQTEESGRGSVPDNADGLIMAYRIDAPLLDAENSTVKSSGKVKRSVFSGPDDKTIKITQTKSTFTMDLGADNAGCVFQFYCRWFNNTHPDLNGPWTGPFSEIII